MPKKSRLVLDPADKESVYQDKQHFLRFASQIILPISVGQPYHEAEKLKEKIQLIKKAYLQAPFLTIRILLADTLQCYSLAMQLEKKPEDCKVLARKKGEEWKERYLLPIKDLLNQDIKPATWNVQLETWDRWRNHELFIPFTQHIENYYKDNPQFREAIEADINEFEQRRRPNRFSETERAYCRAYIKEENVRY